MAQPGHSQDHKRRSDARALVHDGWHLVTRPLLKGIIGRPARRTYTVVLSMVLVSAVIGAGAYTKATLDEYRASLTNPAIILNTKNTGTTITDRNGEVLFRGYGAIERHNIGLQQMPKSLVNATLATEDPDFYRHPGFSLKAMARAAYHDLRHTQKGQGGSTITQQLVKNTLLTNDKTFTRKFKELVLSVEMERRYSKDEILQMYLNTIYYGQGSYGVEAASTNYFRKPVDQLTVSESALLAGLPQSPSLYDPTINKEGAGERRDYVLSRMQEHGYLNGGQVAAAHNEAIVTYPRQVAIKAPHFVFWVLDQLRSQYGREMVEHGGITVTTSLDYQKQAQAEQIVANQVAKLASHNASNGSLVSLDPKTGEVISMVGSIDYYNSNFGSVNTTLAQLQPGSSFKPIAYAAAFSKGWNGATVVDDKPMHVAQDNGQVYSPVNYDGKFRGPVTLRRALANSLNIPAIEVLKHAQIDNTITLAHQLGVQAPSLTDRNRYGLSLVLGGGEVRPIDMAAVYASFANQGMSVQPQAINRVSDKFGADITKKPPQPKTQAVDPRIAYMITNILSDNEARKEEFGPNSPLKLSRPAAAKTGTTNDYRDNWTVGYTPGLVTAVWVGNNDHSAMSNVSGIDGAAPIWHDYMEMASAGTPVQDFTVPAGIAFAKVCQKDGGLAAQNDPSAVNEVFLAEAVQTKPCGSVGAPVSTTPPVQQASSVMPSKPSSTPSQTPVATPQLATTPRAPEEPGRGGGGGTPTPPGGSSDPGSGGSGSSTPPPSGG